MGQRRPRLDPVAGVAAFLRAAREQDLGRLGVAEGEAQVEISRRTTTVRLLAAPGAVPEHRASEQP